MSDHRDDQMKDAHEDPADAAFAQRIAGPLRGAERLDATFDARVMSAVHAIARERTAAAATAHWWQRGRTVRVTPLAGLALAAGLAAVAVLGAATGYSVARSDARGAVAVAPAASAPAAPVADTVHVVRFVFMDREARAVALVGDFNAWTKGATPLVEGAQNGAWTATVTLPPGRHEYAFVVERANGERWMADPYATRVRDEFGTVSSVVTVGRTETTGTTSAEIDRSS